MLWAGATLTNGDEVGTAFKGLTVQWGRQTCVQGTDLISGVNSVTCSRRFSHLLGPWLVASCGGPGRQPWTNPALVPQLSTVIDMLEGALYGLDLLKLHSVTTRLVGRVGQLEEVRTGRAFHVFLLLEPQSASQYFFRKHIS